MTGDWLSVPSHVYCNRPETPMSPLLLMLTRHTTLSPEFTEGLSAIAIGSTKTSGIGKIEREVVLRSFSVDSWVNGAVPKGSICAVTWCWPTGKALRSLEVRVWLQSVSAYPAPVRVTVNGVEVTRPPLPSGISNHIGTSEAPLPLVRASRPETTHGPSSAPSSMATLISP